MDHALFGTGDEDAPEAIKDRNSEVALALCKVCGLAEGDLDETPSCPGRKVKMRDLDKWREFFESFGISLRIRKEDGLLGVYPKSGYAMSLLRDDHRDDNPVVGHTFYEVVLIFDDEGKFVNIGAWSE